MANNYRCTYQIEKNRNQVLNLANLRALEVGTNLTIHPISNKCKKCCGGVVSGGVVSGGVRQITCPSWNTSESCRQLRSLYQPQFNFRTIGGRAPAVNRYLANQLYSSPLYTDPNYVIPPRY